MDAYRRSQRKESDGLPVLCPGAHGHIAIGTNSVDRAVYHLGLQGVKCLEETRKTDGKGKTKAIYLDGTFGGFAIHLVQK